MRKWERETHRDRQAEIDRESERGRKEREETEKEVLPSYLLRKF